METQNRTYPDLIVTPSNKAKESHPEPGLTRRVLAYNDKLFLEIQVKNSAFLFHTSAYATGNDPLGRGDRGPLPLHLILFKPKVFRWCQLCPSTGTSL